MRSTPTYLIIWVSVLTFGLIGSPRFFSIFFDFLSVENDSLGLKRWFVGIVLLAHSPYFVALLLAGLFRPKPKAFSRTAIGGSLLAAMGVVLAFGLYFRTVNETYPVSLQFTDVAGQPLPDLELTLTFETEGFSPSTSPKRTEALRLSNGTLETRKKFREKLTVTTQPYGLTYTTVTILPMGGKYPVGPLQKVDMSWFIDRRGGSRDTYAGGSKNWSFHDGPLAIPIPPAKAPLQIPIPQYTEADWKAVSGIR